MHNGALRKWSLALTLWLALHCSSLRAQLIAPLGTSPTTFGIDSSGLLTSTGALSSGSLTLTGTGSRMIWYPGKAAFRAGLIWNVQGGFGPAQPHFWDDVHIGQGSAAFGTNTSASGTGSAAFGLLTTAAGDGSTASGYCTGVFGPDSTATGWFSLCLGWCSTASGYYASATGNSSLSFGGYTNANGMYSQSFGNYTTADGYTSTVFGNNTSAHAYNSFVIGQYNVGGGNPNSWVSTDPLFEIGNGTVSQHDALLVDKSGNVTAGGVMRCAPGGDLSMGSFTAGTHP